MIGEDPDSDAEDSVSVSQSVDDKEDNATAFEKELSELQRLVYHEFELNILYILNSRIVV